MSEELQSEEQPQTEETTGATPGNEISLGGLFAYKLGMSSIYSQEGKSIPVTVLRFDELKVTQIKTKETDGYNAIQLTSLGKKVHKESKAVKGHLKKSGEEAKSKLCKEVRLKELPEGVALGQSVSIESLQEGDLVKITAKSKGRGFAGVMKRWDFGGGPASHGSSVHRRPGSSGMCTFPGMVMPGKKNAGHFGDETISVRNVQIVGVNKEDGVLLIKGPVPGARNGLVRLMKQ